MNGNYPEKELVGFMDWRKIVESKDLIILEQEQNEIKFKIEARKTENFWEVFKTQIKGTSSELLSEYTVDTRNDVRNLITRLKTENRPSVKRIPSKKGVRISLKRVFKEEFVEKWYFQIDKDSTRNFLLVKFDSEVAVDVVMNEKYRYFESQVLLQIEEKLGLKEIGDQIRYEIYYYNRNIKKDSEKNEYNLVDVEFDFSNEEF
jgi:hypothetical protein